jgi:ribosomal protein S12 methylthiotransferase accessory factor
MQIMPVVEKKIMDNVGQTIEQRAYHLEHALLLGLEEAKINDISIAFELRHKIESQNNHLSTYLCAANDNKAKLSFIAGGSGQTHHAKVKALYESLEYSLSLQALHPNSENIHSFTTLSSPSTPYLQQQELLPKRLFQDKYITNNYPWLRLTKINDPVCYLYYPLSLAFSYTPALHLYPDNFDHHDIDELCNETGFATGASPEEALIHGINEWVERDAYALFLLETIIHKQPKPARFIMKETLPLDLLTMVHMIEQHYQERLILVDITSDINMPAFVVSFTRQSMLVQPLGFGASLSKHAALQQALLEVLQYKDRFNDNAQAFREASFAYFAKHELIIKAMKCDLRELSPDRIMPIDWKDITTHPLASNLEGQLACMNALLTQRGANIYYNHLYQSDNGFSLTYTLITGLETFFLIKDAKFVPLKKRGLGVFQCS